MTSTCTPQTMTVVLSPLSIYSLKKQVNPNAETLFNHCYKDALNTPGTEQYWYNCKSVKPYQFSRFMADIAKNSMCKNTYTAHCLRATSIQHMSDAGFQLRYIMYMYMTGHKMKALSVRTAENVRQGKKEISVTFCHPLYLRLCATKMHLFHQMLQLHRHHLHCRLLQITIATKLTQLVVMSCLRTLFPTLHLLTELLVFIKMM